MNSAQGEPSTPSRRTRRLRAAAFALVVGAQVGVPAFVLSQSLQDREQQGFARQYAYGWQMYEGRNLDVSYRVTGPGGATRSVDPAAEPGGLGYVHYGTGAFERLCRADRRRRVVTREAVIRGLTRPVRERFPCP